MDDIAAKQRLLERAATLLGQEDLARRLNVPASLIEAWIRGDATMPDGRLMDLARVLDSFSRQARAPGQKNGGEA